MVIIAQNLILKRKMNLVKDLWSHLKEWSDWKMKDWIKAGIVAIIVIVVISQIGGGGAWLS